ncbi:MAG: replication restart helicase PriA [bacterium]
MDQIIKVVVDLPLRKLNKEFDYLLPEKFKPIIKVGQIVKVPFGRRKISAFVTQINADSEVEKSKLKKVESILYQQSFFDEELLQLFYWTASYYHAYLAQVIKSVLPAGITDKKIKKKKVEFLKLNSEIDNFEIELEKLKNRAPKQYLILKYLLEHRQKKIRLKTAVKYAETSKQTVYRLIDKNLIFLYTDTKERNPEINSILETKNRSDFSITKEEERTIESIINNEFAKNSYLLTTENNKKRYNFIIKFLEKLIKENKNVILLVPEIEKDSVFLEQLNNYFKDNIAFLHSQLSKGELFDQWLQIKKGKIKLAVGARSAIFAPFSQLDAVIIMEENNESYKGQEHPLYHARQIAAKRLKRDNSILILESPVPSLESKYHAFLGEYEEIEFAAEKNKRQQQLVDMKKEVEKGNLSDLSQILQSEIRIQLAKNKKVILFLNRRGSANYLICRKCGNVIKCDNCDISLNYHKKEQKLICHYCGLKKEVPDKCPECGSAFISRAGVGTEKIIEELRDLYPKAEIVRVDSDLKEKDLKERLLAFKKGEIDILVGTSILIKNQFYDKLNFLGVVSADTALNNSDFRAAENNYFLLNQLKSLLLNSEKSKFFLQSYEPEHYSIQEVLKTEEDDFYQKESEIRKNRNYPPFCRLINIIISAQDKQKVLAKSKKLSTFLDNYSDKYVEKLGEAPAGLSKIRNKYRRQIILKFNSIRNREYIIQLIEKKFIESENNDSVEIRIDVDPYQML